jgi:Ca2+-binding RTX toxin-like protein
MTVVNSFNYTFLTDSTAIATNLNTVDSAQNVSGVDVGGSWFDVWKGGFGTIYGRVLGAPTDGSTPFVINTTHQDSNQNDPDIAQLSGGHVVVTFHDASAGDEVRFRLFDASGTGLGSDVAINGGSGLKQSEAAVSALADGGFAVAWTADQGSGAAPNTTVLSQTFNADGSARSAVVALDGFGLSAAHADLAGLKNGGFVGVWQEGQGGIYASVNGAPKFLVADSGGLRDDPRVAALKDGGFAVTYGGWGGSNNDIYLALYNADGSARVAPEKVNTTPAGLVGDQHLSQIAVLQDGAVAVTWETTGSGGATNINLYDPYSGALLYSPPISLGNVHQDISLQSNGTGLTLYAVSANTAFTRHIDFSHLLGSDADSDVVIGTGLDETIMGANGGKVLDGGNGTDTISFETAGAGVTASLALQGGAQQTGGAGLETLSNFENLTGSGFADTLTGNTGANVITGGGGDDIIDGGGGDDTLDGGGGVNTVSFAAAGHGVTASLLLQGGAQATGIGSETLKNFANIIGSAYDDVLIGNGGNTISGGGGDDIIQVGGSSPLSADVLDGGAGTNTVSFANAGSGVTVNLALQGSAQATGVGSETLTNFQNLTGSAYADTLRGDGGDNVIDGGGGNDVLDGAGGVNTVTFASAGHGVTISLSLQGSAQSTGDGSETPNGLPQTTGPAFNPTLTNFQNLTGSAYNDTLTGDAGANVIRGGAGDDLIDGHGGADTLDGGTSINTVSFASAGAGVTVSLLLQGSAQATGVGSQTLTNFQKLTGSAFDDVLTGDAGNNTIAGGGGNDVISGGGGDDIIDGGPGNDTLDGGTGINVVSFASAASAVTVSLALQGSAQATGLGLDTLSNFETLVGSAYNDVLTGDASANHILGQDGDDVIDGHGGDDYLDGGAGTNTVSFASAAGGVTVTLDPHQSTQSSGVGSVRLTRFQNLTGSGFDDNLSGEAGANVISGGGGNDIVDGEGGADTLDGGAGVNTVTFASAATGVAVSLLLQGSAQATGVGSDTLSNFQNVTGSAFDDTLTGDASANLLSGGGGNDLIDGGGGGSDSLDGGTGVNTVSFASAGSGVTVGLALQGSAQATGVGLETLSNFQNLTGSAFADILSGDAGANVILGGGGNDVIDGHGGADTLDGGTGVNTVTYASSGSGVTVGLGSPGSAQNTGVGSQTLTHFQNLIGSAYADNLSGDDNDNVISGGGGNDYLYGAGGDDTLDGGDGNDNLNGGGGVNTVSFASSSAGVTVSLALVSAQATGAGVDTLSNFQNLTGSAFADTLTGDSGANVISGGGGNDRINGGGGGDTLTGGSGADTFVFRPGQAGQATITDFSVAQGDQVDLTAFGAIHSLLGLAANISASGSDTVIALGNVSVTLSGVTPSSLTAAQFLLTPGTTPPPVTVPPSDFNHDGVSDILLRDSTTGDFGYMALSPLGASSWQAVGSSNPSYGVFAVADFNGDGASDMLLRNDTTGDVGFMDMTPGGGPVWHDIGGSAVSYTVQGTGDFNGDHVTDMLWRNDNSGDVGYTALTSSGGANWVHLGNSSTAYTVEGTGDFNGDGVSDLLFRNDSTGDVGYTALTPSGGARWVYLGGSATAYAVQGSGDFNGDGVSDLLFRNQSTGDYGYTALTPSGGATWHALGVSDPSYTIVATGDFNGDGRADVLQRNTTSGDYGYMATSGSTGVWHDVGVTDSSHFII